MTHECMKCKVHAWPTAAMDLQVFWAMRNNSLPGIADYGIIGNSRTAALISNRGSIDWCCFPKFDSEAFFSALVDPELGGVFSISPDSSFEASQSYLADTNILETTFTTEVGILRLSDCMTVASEEEKQKSLWPDTEILRTVECLEGEARLLVRLRPKGRFGRDSCRLRQMGQWGLVTEYGRKTLFLQTSIGVSQFSVRELPAGAEAMAQIKIRKGEILRVSLIYSDQAPSVIAPLGEASQRRLDSTLRYWRGWMSRCRYEGPYQAEVRRSALVLKLLTYAPSGAIVAAPTASLPETIGGERNWDYRFCWLRDASFTVRALVSLGYFEEAKAYASWLLHATALTHPRLQVLYSVYGESRLQERTLASAQGYAGSKPVRIGNAASDQFQLDVYGEVIDAISGLHSYLGEIDRDTRKFMIKIGEVLCQLWDMPDQGIWELRSSPLHHTHSKVMAWVGLDRILSLSSKLGWKIPHAKFVSARAEIRRMIEAQAYDVRLGSYTRSFGDQELDASLLTIPLVGYIDGRDPRVRNTLVRVGDKLSRNGLLYRYQAGSDGLPGREGAFGICNFWMAEAWIRAGRPDLGRIWIENMLKHRNTLGLWPEQIDPESGAFLGNYPQGFTHIGLINASVALVAHAAERRAA